MFDVSHPGAPTQLEKLTGGLKWSIDAFGSPVAIDVNVARVAANNDDQAAGNAGAVYV